jgi:GTP cyclohydrolase I
MNPEKREKLEKNPKIMERAEAVKTLLNSIPKEKADRAGLTETPLRVAAMYDELFWGYKVDPAQYLRDALFIEPGSDELILVKEIPFYSTCEHHMEAIIGVAAIAYIPQGGKIVGLSKIARVVDAVAHKLQVQERIGTEILAAINEALNPLGAAVIIQARHMCMERRGIQKPGTITVTSTLSGIFRMNPESKRELWSMLSWKASL